MACYQQSFKSQEEIARCIQMRLKNVNSGKAESGLFSKASHEVVYSMNTLKNSAINALLS